MLKLEEINEKLNKYGILPIEQYNGLKCKYNLEDIYGYKYYVSLFGLINKNKFPWKFHKSNPYSIDNIKNFIKINNIGVELLSDEYKNNTEKLKFRCKCGEIFYRTLMDFQKSYYCNDCIKREHTTSEEVLKDRLEKLGYILDKHCGCRLAEFHDIEGYKYKRDVANNFKGKFNKFDKGNPFTIDNIRNYIKLNNINSTLVSDTYNGNNVDMDWKCNCGNLFKATWNEFLQGKTCCNDCVIKQNKIKNNEKYKYQIKEFGYIPLFDYIDSVEEEKITIKDEDGYLYYCWFYDLKQNKKPSKFGKSNKYTIENINLLLKQNNKEDYKCISDFLEYLGNNENLRFLHIPCGTEFNATLIEMQGRLENSSKKIRYHKQCPNCFKPKKESNHALVLKQIFLHELCDTTIEDKSCINPKTKRALPTDIVNHNLKIAIEIQSAYHDKKEQKEKDLVKKNFWINNGYDFFALDIRKYTVLEMCKIFFPYLEEIPDYVDYNFSNCIDFNLVQNYLNNGYSIREISEIMNQKHGTIQSLVYRKVVTLPENYYKDVLKRRPIVRLSKNGDYISRFITASEANKQGFKSGTVNRVLKGKQKYAYNSIWVYEDDYLSGNYVIQ